MFIYVNFLVFMVQAFRSVRDKAMFSMSTNFGFLQSFFVSQH